MRMFLDLETQPLARPTSCFWLIAVGLCGFPLSVWSGEYNHRPVTTGERSAGLGGAYVALADDETGTFYNPAGIAHADSGGPSGTVNVVSVSTTRYRDVFGSTNWSRESLEVLPSFFGALGNLGSGKIGASLVVVDSVAEDQTDLYRDVTVGSTTYDELRVHNNYGARTYDIGLSYAGKLQAEGWSLGSTLYLQYLKRDRSFLQRLSDDADRSTVQDDTAILVQVEHEDEQVALRPIMGVMYRNARVSWGLSISQVLPLTREYFYAFAGDAVSPSGSLSFDVVDQSDRTERYPFMASTGLAIFASEATTLSLQLDYFGERHVDRSGVPGGAPPRDLKLRPVVNVSAGMESVISPLWTVRGGIYTDFANNKADEAALFERREEIDVYGATLSMSRRVGKGYWTVGFDVAYGEGDATLGDVGFGTDATGVERVDASKLSYNLLLSTAW